MQTILSHVGESEVEYRSPPCWETTFVEVSLLEMLEFSAKDFVEMSYTFGVVLASWHRDKVDAHDLGRAVRKLLEESKRLGLPVTNNHLREMMVEIARENPDSTTLVDGTLIFKGGELPSDRIGHHIEAVYSTLRAELGALLFKTIPPLKSKYCDPEWLMATPINIKLPETIDEFHKSGRSFAYGENVACVFHLMRVTDFCLRKVAESLGIAYDARNWHGIGDMIRRKMEEKYNVKSDEWKQKEPFYAEILTDIQAIGRGHRNPALHELEKQYDEREAEYMLTVIEAFSIHVAEKL